MNEFWTAFASPNRSLTGLRVHDPFIGGGSTLVEAARLGADVSGGDIDPLAVEITRHELEPAPAEEVRDAGEELLSFLRVRYNDLYPSDSSAEIPLHYFWLHEVTCPNCDQPGLLYRNLILVRDPEKHGAVVRDRPLTVFCPADLSVHHLDTLDQRELVHCGNQWNILEGTFTKFRYVCPTCGRKSKHSELRTGVAPRRLAAVEVTVEGERRRLRASSASDYRAIEEAKVRLQDDSLLRLPQGRLTPDRYDDRPISYGIETAAQLFSERQLLPPPSPDEAIADAIRQNIGNRGEAYSYQLELLNAADRSHIVWVARDNSDLGYDIEDRSVNPRRRIEVKASGDIPVRFLMSDNEYRKSGDDPTSYEVHFWGGIDLNIDPAEEYTRLRRRGYPLVFVDIPALISAGDFEAKPTKWRLIKLR